MVGFRSFSLALMAQVCTDFLNLNCCGSYWLDLTSATAGHWLDHWLRGLRHLLAHSPVVLPSCIKYHTAGWSGSIFGTFLSSLIVWSIIVVSQTKSRVFNIMILPTSRRHLSAHSKPNQALSRISLSWLEWESSLTIQKHILYPPSFHCPYTS